MDLSLWPSAHRPWTEVLAAAGHAERTGWLGVWIAEHFMPDAPTPPAALPLAHRAQSTKRGTSSGPPAAANSACTASRSPASAR